MTLPTVLLPLGGDTTSYAEALTAAGFDPISDEAGAFARLSSGMSFDVAVVDCDAAMSAAPELFAFLHGDRPVPTVLLFSDDIPEWAVAPGGAGASDEFARKPVSASALAYRLEAIMIRAGRTLPTDAVAPGAEGDPDQETIGEGRVVSLFSPKGGVGKTMIAVNLAVALREQTHASVCLLDADVGVGNLSTVLDAPYRRGLADLADSPASEWTSAAFEQIAATHAASGVRVLSWGTDPGDATRVGVDLLQAAVRWARAHHAWVVIDSHPNYDDRTMAMLAVSRDILLVVTPELGPLRNATQFISLAKEIGLGGSVKVIVNRANHGVSRDDIARTLGLPISATVVSNGPKAIAASNEGTPLITKYPREQIATDLHNVARLLTRPEPIGVPAGRRSWLAALGLRSNRA
ncbi:MAG TPA: P-loop NTPase [Candidatus Limnocylindria bacterium]|nr:P-loop NTPase [Candidatus Limnocylindria bacterium]